MNRRRFIDSSAKAGIGVIAAGAAVSTMSSCSTARALALGTPYSNDPGFDQRSLPYAYNALEPAIDAQTMEIHFTRHAKGYSDKLKEALGEANVTGVNLTDLLANIARYSTAIRNNGGGHYNHEMFWRTMAPGGKSMSSAFQSLISSQFGSTDKLKTDFANAATSRFGSGWAWLALDGANRLKIGSTPNQDNPLMNVGDFRGFPLLGIDVWEHAYYLKYQNKRADYIKAWWDIVNWQEVEERYNFATGRLSA